jgi:hypothetical protein
MRRSTAEAPDMNFKKPRLQGLECRVAPATFTVTNTNDSGTGSLRDALAKADASPGADKIVFKLPAPPLHGENVIMLTTGELLSKGNVTITGPGSGKLIIDANNASRVFHIDDGSTTTDSPSTISGLSVIRGKTSGVGGGVYSLESLTLRNVVVSECNAAGASGGVNVVAFAPGSKVQVIDSWITENSTAGITGGIWLVASSVTVQKTIVTGNTAAKGAGGMNVQSPISGTGIDISGCVINGNSASYGGGLQFNNQSTKAKTTISNTTIDGNTAAGGLGGGGVFVAFGNTSITGSAIRNNTTTYYGGGLREEDGMTSLTISRSTISGNQTTSKSGPNQGGGGIAIRGGFTTPQRLNITGSSIVDNRSAEYGGGLLVQLGVEVTISGSAVADNHAASNGGGLYATGTGANNKVDVTIKGSTFSDNLTNQSGGGLFAVGDGQITITSTKVTGNVANADGGGMYLKSTASKNGVLLNNVTVSQNTASNLGFGGGIAITSTPDFHFSGGSFTNNRAQEGGGIEVISASGSILGALVANNEAQIAGGGVFGFGSAGVALQIVKVFGNTAPTDPDVSGTFMFV